MTTETPETLAWECRKMGEAMECHPAANGTISHTEEAGAKLREAAAALESKAAQIEVLRAALIACREPVEFDRSLQQMLLGPGDGDVNAYRKNRIARLSSLLDTIDAEMSAPARLTPPAAPL